MENREIREVLHFTRIENLPGIFEHGLLSRSDLQHADYDVYPSDGDRLDQDNDVISVSISCYYPKMFEAKRFRSGNGVWAVLIFDSRILWECSCRFFANGVTTNATKYEHGKRYGGFALEKMFSDYSPRGDSNRPSFRAEHGLPPSWPTSPDAEVQVSSPVPISYLLGAWVEMFEHGILIQRLFEEYGFDSCEVVVHSFRPRIQCSRYCWG